MATTESTWRCLAETKEGRITLIWFDSIGSKSIDIPYNIQNLRRIHDHVLVYTNVDECHVYIRSKTQETIFLICAEAWASVLLPSIIELKQLVMVFLFSKSSTICCNIIKQYQKIAGVFTNQDDLEKTIRQHISPSIKRLDGISFYEQHESFSIDLSEREAEFLWFQLFYDVIREFQPSQQAREEMIGVCRSHYCHNEKEMTSIEKFEKTYTRDTCIQWFTEETFVYKMINKALRTEDVQQLYTFRFFIVDFSLALAKEHQKMKMESTETGRTMTVYRGVRLSSNELEQLRSYENKLISFNGYVSTSCLRQVAIRFAREGMERPNTVSVLYEIKCCIDHDWPIFANIAQFSRFQDEQEVLFDIGAVFQVGKLIEKKDLWIIPLTAADEGREIVKQYIEATRKEMEGDSNVILFGSLLTRMGQYEKAQRYFEQLLKESEDDNSCYIHNQLGLIQYAKADYDSAMVEFETAYRSMIGLAALKRDSTRVLRNMSNVRLEQGYYQRAIGYSNRAKEILNELTDACELDLALCLDTIGLSYQGLENYSEAILVYEEALNFKRTCLPNNHAHIAKSLNLIGFAHLLNKDIEMAYNFCSASLTMYHTCLPNDHPDIANVHQSIAEYYRCRRQYEEALQHLHLALTMKEKYFSANHPSIAAILNSISIVLSAKGERQQALNLCLKALQMRQERLPVHHPDLAISFSSLGSIYEAMTNYRRALEYYEQALQINDTSLAKDHPLRKRTDANVMRMRWRVF